MKILAFTPPGTNSRRFFLDIVQSIGELGHEVLQFELEPYIAVLEAMGEHVERAIEPLGKIVLSLIETNGIDLSMAMWSGATLSLPLYLQADGSTVSFLDYHGHPHLHYWWDAPHWYHGGKEIKNIANGLYRGAHQFHYINNPGTGSEMASLMGFKNVIPSPNGVNPRLFLPRPEIPKEYDLVFVSGPGDPAPTEVMLQELEQDDPDVDRIRKDVAMSLRPKLDALVESVDGSVREPMRKLFDAMVEARLADRHSPALVHLQRAVQHDVALAVAADALIKDLVLYVKVTDTIRQIEKWERPFMVAYLSRHFNCLRLGQQSYDVWGIEGDASGFVEYERQSEVYAKGRFALNVMRWQDDIGVNSKVFEITACGAACLQAYRGGIDELFEVGKEILVFKTPGEARQQLSEALSSPSRVEELAEAGRSRTLRDHTWAKRMEGVLDMVREYWMYRRRLPAPSQTSLGADSQPAAERVARSICV
ncbi:MAG: glycosyltransferase family 1 protein [Planctomycetes bacterium]|nr:glycosyltransferase family 1 protein [Planctomycetota bacterium]